MSQYPNLTVNSKGHLKFGGCDLIALAGKFGTPLYVMNEDIIRSNAIRYVRGLKRCYPNSDVVYAGKAFLSGWMCSVIDEEGMLLDVVSGGELYTAIRAGFSPGKIVFHGNNKSSEEIAMGINVGVGRFVVDSYHEMEILNKLARKAGKKADILLRIAPGIEAHTHEYVETGMLDSKFGFGLSNGEALKASAKAISLGNLNLLGFHSHIGSQILDLKGPVEAAKRMIQFIFQVKDKLGFITRELDLGGGLGILDQGQENPPEIESYLGTITDTVLKHCSNLGLKLPKLLIEPGRSIVGEAGLTLYKAGAVKHIPGIRTYVCVDGGMADNPRPALYGSPYNVLPAAPGKFLGKAPSQVSLAGKCCESGDILIKQCMLPNVKSGDILAVLNTGAYNYSMASNYNCLPRPAVVALSKGFSRVVVRRETYKDLVSRDLFSPMSSVNSGKPDTAASAT